MGSRQITSGFHVKRVALLKVGNDLDPFTSALQI